jgi:hypothetical protein
VSMESSKTTRRLGATLAGTPEERLKIVLQQALDEALRLYVVNQFSVLMKEPTGHDRARAGVRKAVAAWNDARKALDEWEPEE